MLGKEIGLINLLDCQMSLTVTLTVTKLPGLIHYYSDLVFNKKVLVSSSLYISPLKEYTLINENEMSTKPHLNPKVDPLEQDCG